MTERIEQYRKERDAIIRDTFQHNSRVYYKACIYRGEEARYFSTNGHNEIIVTINSDPQENWILTKPEFLKLIEVKNQ